MTVTPAVSTEVAVRAEFQCELLQLTEGRCAGIACDKHHVRYRSQGGGDESENLIYICRRHHNQIHDGKLTGPFEDDHGRYYAQDVGPKDRIAKTRWYVWHDLREFLEARYIENTQVLAEGARWGKKGQWAICWALEEMSRLALWQMADDLNADDTSFGSYLRARGMDVNDTSLNQYCNVVASLRSLGVGLSDLVEAVDACGRVHDFPPGYGAVRDNLPAIRKMNRDEIVGLLSNTPSADFRAAIADTLEASETQKAIAKGDTRVQMDATLTVEIQHVMTSVGTENGDWEKLEGRIRQAIGKRGVPGSFRFKRQSRRVVGSP